MPELTEVTFGRVAHTRKTENNADLLSARARKTRIKQKFRFLRSFHEAASRVDRKQSAICENVSCMMESMAESFDRAPVIHPQRKGDVSKRLRKYTMRSGLSPPLTRELTLA